MYIEYVFELYSCGFILRIQNKKLQIIEGCPPPLFSFKQHFGFSDWTNEVALNS